MSEMVGLMHGGAPGAFEALLRQRAAERIRDVGNGGQEIRTWLAAAAAASDPRGAALFYEPMPRWLTGICVFRWQTAG